MNLRNIFFPLLFLFVTTLLLTGCIRLVGKAGYVTETPNERTERVYGVDTAELVKSSRT